MGGVIQYARLRAAWGCGVPEALQRFGGRQHGGGTSDMEENRDA